MKNLYTYIIALMVLGCSNSVELEPVNGEKSGLKTGVFGGNSSGETPSDAASNGIIRNNHEVKVLEHIPGQRYSYLNVEENGKAYWVATMREEFAVNESYAYNEGIEKMEYTSTELQRTFDRIILVSKLFPVSDHESHAHANSSNSATKIAPTQEKVIVPKSSTPIKKIVENSKLFKNKSVEVTGRVVKVNPGIMDRNWIHLQDDTKNEFDFVCTSNQDIPVGHTVTLKGVITLNKDFGAGYSYDIIMENATVK